MDAPTQGMLLRIFIGESDRWEGKSLYEALVREAKAHGLAGATVVHGSMGYGAHSRIHTARLVDISPGLPIVVEIVDEEAKIQAFLPTVEAMVHEGLITLERVSVLLYRHRGQRVRQQDADGLRAFSEVTRRRKMEYRYFGTTGMRVSAIGLGCNPFGNEVDAEGASAIVDRALDLGVTYFDTADSYFEGRSEEYLGRALRGRRDGVVVATKAGNATGPGLNDTGASRRHLMEAVEASLRRLQTDYIDVYQIHSPDRHTPAEETMRALDDMVHQGKVRYIGCSNYFEWEACEAIWTARLHHLTPFVSCQEFFNLLYRDAEKRMVPFCQKYGLALIPYFPLAGAMLSGTYQRGSTPAGTRGAIRPSFKRWDSERNWAVQEKLAGFARERGYSLPQLAIAWLLTRPMLCTVIAGSDRPEHIENNAGALDVQLSPEDLAEIDAITLVEEDRTIAPVLRAGR